MVEIKFYKGKVMLYRLIIVCTFLFSCSRLPIIEVNKKVPKDSEMQSKVINFGPTKVGLKSPFRDVTDQYGLKGVEGVTFYAVDFDHDQYTDLVILPDYYSLPAFYRFNPKGEKYELLDYSPLSRDVWASYMLFYDINRDGLLDIVLGAPKRETSLDQSPLRLFIAHASSGKLHYEEKKNVFPNELYTTYGVTPLDIDLDGELDLFLGNWYDKYRGKLMVSPDRLYRYKNGKFSDFSTMLDGEMQFDDELQLYTEARPTFGVSTCDVDQNGFADIMTSSSNGMGNKLWLNLPDEESGRVFIDHGKDSGYAFDREGMLDRMGGGDSYFARCTDYNNDGIVDIVSGELSHSYDASTRDRSAVLSGSTFKFPPRFIRTEYFMDDGALQWNQGDKRVTFLDYNLDGLIDMAIDNNGFPPESRLIFFKQQDNHAYVDRARDYGIDLSNPSGSITLDFNRDGKPDLLVGQVETRSTGLKKRIFLFENTQEFDGNKSFQIYLKGTKSNPFAWGASVRLVGNEVKQWRYNMPVAGGFSSQDEDGMIFGVPKGEPLKRLEITWPIRNQKGNAIKRTYPLNTLKLKDHNVFTACESGELLPGKTNCP